MKTEPAVSDSVQEMQEALGLEIASLRSRGGTTRLEVKGGKRTGESGGLKLYSFPTPSDLPGRLREDMPLRVLVKDRQLKGLLVSLGEKALVIGLEEDLGAHIAAATLVSDEADLLEALRDRIGEALEGKLEFHPENAARILGEAGLAGKKVAEEELPEGILDELNPEQKKAVRKALGSQGLFIWGPPGTGKTTVVARIVEALSSLGKSVLLLSNTNIAVDTALEKICERLEDTPEFQGGKVLRVGPIVKPELGKKYGNYLDLEQAVRRLTVPLRTKKTKALKEQAACQAEIQRLDEQIAEWKQIEALRSELERFEAQAKKTLFRTEGVEIQLAGARTRVSETKARLAAAETMGGFRRFLAGADPGRLRRDLSRYQTEVKNIEAACQAGREKAAQAKEQAAEIRARLVHQERAVKGRPDRKGLETERFGWVEMSEELAGTIRELDTRIEEVRETVRQTCTIMGTTVYRSYLKGGVERTFDVVVLDEASMVMLPMAWFAAGLGEEGFVVAGDFRQLPAIVGSQEPAAQEWLKESVFEKNGVPFLVGTKNLPRHLAGLRIQYRMDPPISNLVSDLFYPEHRLEPGPPVLSRKAHGWEFLEGGLAYVDTAELRSWVARPEGSWSRYNLLHATLMRNLVLRFQARGVLKEKGGRMPAIGLISPYAAQARLTERLLEERFGEGRGPVAATVHRFQGNEKEVILLDIPDSLGLPPSRFIKARNPDEDGSRLFNVALSRARRGVLLVADFAWLRRNLNPETCVFRVLDEMEAQGTRIPLEEVLPAGEEDWVDGLDRTLPAGTPIPDEAAGAFDEGSFYPAFLEDLKHAKENLTLVSPFLTAAGTSRWAEVFRSAIRKGVRIHLLIRPPGDGLQADGQYDQIVAGLRELGVVVDQVAGIHQKIACVDGRILWHGSLNILSHRNTAESMLRLPSPAACEAVLGFLRPRKGQGGSQGDSDAGNPECPECGSATIRKTGRFGIYYQCSAANCRKTFDLRRRKPRRASSSSSRRRHGQGEAGDPCPSEDCPGVMVPRKGRHGPFLGCSEYPRCHEWLGIRE